MEEEKTKKDLFTTRIHEIDFIRGFLMCLVILDHIFNLIMSFNGTWAGAEHRQPFYDVHNFFLYYWTSPVRTVVRWIVLGSFCFVSGLSCAFSRNNWKRAAQMILVWMMVLLVSNGLEAMRVTLDLDLGVRTMRCDFNILGVLAWSMLIYCFFQDKSWKALLVMCIVGLAAHPICVILSKTDWGQNGYFIPFWQPNPAIADQADYLSMFPYLGYFFGGALLSSFTYAKERKSYIKRYNWERPICFVGRHSLLIYGLHFLVLIGIFYFIGLFIR